MNPKMILTDLDKTLLRSDGSISEHTKQVLKKCQTRGILIVIATARYWIGAERCIEEIQPDYEITTDGTLIHQRGKQIYSCSMDTDAANQIIFGDDANDVEMLQICGTGVAVSNAVMEAKAAADYVTRSNDEDGVADWIEKNILATTSG